MGPGAFYPAGRDSGAMQSHKEASRGAWDGQSSLPATSLRVYHGFYQLSSIGDTASTPRSTGLTILTCLYTCKCKGDMIVLSRNMFV